MIWQLVKRDPLWEYALILLPAGAGACALLPREFMGWLAFPTIMLWFQNQPQQRATIFQAALPIRACDLFLARIVAQLALVWLPVAGGAAVVWLTGKPAEYAATLFEIGAGISVVVLAGLSSRVREIAGSVWVAGIAAAAVWAAAWPVSVFVPPATVLAVCAPLCAGLFWNIWRQLPPAFEVLPAKLTEQASSQSGNSAAPGFVWWPVLRALFPPRTVGFLPMILMVLAAGQWQYVTVACMLPVSVAVMNMPWVLSLPIRRSALLAVLLLPWVPALLLVTLRAKGLAEAPIRIVRSKSHRISEVRPALEFWHTGKAPVIVSPWGESWQPETITLGGVAIYNPYSFGPAHSQRFFEWQFRRATEAVYGKAIDYAEFQRHRPERPLTRQSRLAILNLSAAACTIMLLLTVLFTGMHWRARRLFDRAQTVAVWLVMGIPGLLLMLLDMTPKQHWEGPITISLGNALLLRISAMLPAGLPAVALVAAIPVALLAWTAARLFRGVELPQTPAAART